MRHVAACIALGDHERFVFFFFPLDPSWMSTTPKGMGYIATWMCPPLRDPRRHKSCRQLECLVLCHYAMSLRS